MFQHISAMWTGQKFCFWLQLLDDSSSAHVTEVCPTPLTVQIFVKLSWNAACVMISLQDPHVLHYSYTPAEVRFWDFLPSCMVTLAHSWQIHPTTRPVFVCFMLLFLAQIAEKVALHVQVLFCSLSNVDLHLGTEVVPGARCSNCTSDPANSFCIRVNKITQILLWDFSNNKEGEDLWCSVRMWERAACALPFLN